VLSAFSPARDMPGQRAGVWYVRGSFTIADPGASTSVVTARHSARVVRGTLSAETRFDPAVQKGPLKGTVRLPAWLAGASWTSGGGTLAANERLEGRIDLVYDQWKAGN
jgi:hypothetical protein